MTTVRAALDAVRGPVALLTAIPVAGPTTGVASPAYALFPVVGLLIGGCLVLADVALRELLPAEPAAAAVVVALVVLTGGLHLDGLADSADGLFGGRDPARRLAIMDDPRNGAFALIAISCVLLLKWTALLSLDEWPRIAALLLAPALARWAVVAQLRLFTPARPSGMAFAARSGLSPRDLALATAVALAAALGVLWPGGATLVPAALLVALAFGWYATIRLGGITGDICGATIEITEVAILLLVASSIGEWGDTWAAV